MDNQKIIKEAFQSAQNELDKERLDNVKRIVLRTLRQIEQEKKQIWEHSRNLQILKLDIEDFKKGRLDKIVQRQEVDKKAREISIIRVEQYDDGRKYKRPQDRPYKITDNQGGSFLVANDTSSTLMLSTTAGNYSTALMTGGDFYQGTSGTYSTGDQVFHINN